MTPAAIAICIACQFLLVIGQLFLKHAMGGKGAASSPPSGTRAVTNLRLGVGCLTLWFFLWLGVLERWELSHVFPFRKRNPALLVVAAWFFLKERVSLQAWIGVMLICVGIFIVAAN